MSLLPSDGYYEPIKTVLENHNGFLLATYTNGKRALAETIANEVAKNERVHLVIEWIAELFQDERVSKENQPPPPHSGVKNTPTLKPAPSVPLETASSLVPRRGVPAPVSIEQGASNVAPTPSKPPSKTPSEPPNETPSKTPLTKTQARVLLSRVDNYRNQLHTSRHEALRGYESTREQELEKANLRNSELTAKEFGEIQRASDAARQSITETTDSEINKIQQASTNASTRSRHLMEANLDKSKSISQELLSAQASGYSKAAEWEHSIISQCDDDTL